VAYDPIRDEVAISSAALNLLTRDVMLAGTVWRDPVTDFARKKDETVSVYLPAYAVANKRALRANAARVRSTLHERKVDVSLTHDLQVDVPLTDENQTLDFTSLVSSVVAPSVGAIVRAYDEEIAAVMEDADYEVDIEWDTSNPYGSLVDARVALDDASVPATGRFLVVGSQLAAQLLKDNLLVAANTSGSTQTLRNGIIGQVASFNVLQSAFIGAEVGFAYHQTAFALASRAPVVPQGVAWGNVQSSDGLAIRVMQHLADDGTGDLLNLVYHDSWFGCQPVTDSGEFNDAGKFIPSIDPEESGVEDLFVRAVKIEPGS
jgi:hypothetical protein